MILIRDCRLKRDLSDQISNGSCAQPFDITIKEAVLACTVSRLSFFNIFLTGIIQADSDGEKDEESGNTDQS